MSECRLAVVLPDVHLEQDTFAKPYSLTREYVARIKPHKIILLGDFMDCSSLSFHDDNKRGLMENRRYAQECDFANSELDFLSKHTKEIVYIEGNHEQRVERWIEQDPQKLSGTVDLSIKLSLHKRGIRFCRLNTLYKLGKCYFTHGVYINQYHAAKHLQRFGCSLVYGHTHTAQTAQMNMKMQDPIMAYGLGCLCDHEPDYMRGKPANWINQVCDVEYNEKTGRFNVNPINITDGQFIRNGKQYC